MDRIQQSLSRSRRGILGGLRGLFSKDKGVETADLEHLEEILLSSDVGLSVTLDLVNAVERVLKKEKNVQVHRVIEVLKEEMTRRLEEVSSEPNWNPGGTTVWLLLGMNGAGKTTTVAKLAHYHQQRGKRVMLACADTFRAAATEQLSVWAERLDVSVIRQGKGSDPAAVCHDAVQSALARDMDLLLIDTAGRMHTRGDLMEELAKIHRVVARGLEGAPHECLLVIDAPTGQNAISQAQRFSDGLGVTGICLTKLDGTAKGGVVLAIAGELRIPIQWVGIGEGLEHLEPFNAAAFIQALLEEGG